VPNWLKWVITGLVALVAAGIAAWLTWWAPAIWSTARTRSTDFGLLTNFVQCALWAIGAVAFPFRWWLSHRLAPPVAKTFLHDLRLPVQGFVGRTKELRELRQQLRSGGALIYGMPGVGKTELALKLARDLRRCYRHAQFDLNLAGTTPEPLKPTNAMSQVILGFHPEAKLPEGEAELRARYCSALDGKRALLLMDNAADANQVRPLVPPASCVLLVTSRHHFTLPGLFATNLDVLPPADARDLLLKIAPRIGNRAGEIARLCGYLPLALRAAGSLLAATPDLDPAQYAQALHDERQRLERIGTEGVPIGVEASFGLSYQRLPDDAAAVFRKLAVFPGTFDAEAEEAVCEDAEHRRLSELVRRSLVQWDAKSERYRLHDLVRLFAQSRLAEDQRQAAQLRHAHHYLAVLSTANDFYLKGGDGILRGLGLYDTEQTNVQAGQAWAARHAAEDDTAARLCSDYPDAGVYVLSLRLHPREHISWLEAGLAGARRLKDREAEGRHLGNLGNAYAALGETRKAIEFYEQALAILRQIGDRRAEGQDLGNLGLAYAALGETRKAIEFFEQQLTITREIGDRPGEGTALGNLGNAYAALGETRKAIEFYEQRLNIAREIGDRRGEGTALWNMSLALDRLGQRAQAIANAEAALAIYQQIESPNAEMVRRQLAEWRKAK